jgi:hypothetical protein
MLFEELKKVKIAVTPNLHAVTGIFNDPNLFATDPALGHYRLNGGGPKRLGAVGARPHPMVAGVAAGLVRDPGGMKLR